ncbi:hypothetical protein BKA62DRAFT_723192 [Auriculariales sp. MPI-PUGE-AT-0066]|nr:hypothetical protein BKA62DRAFT_723192 [Auriculariales sp. MPI-PUGE-AT-0066]
MLHSDLLYRTGCNTTMLLPSHGGSSYVSALPACRVPLDSAIKSPCTYALGAAITPALLHLPLSNYMSATATRSRARAPAPSLAARRAVFPVVDDQSDYESAIATPAKRRMAALPEEDRRPMRDWRVVDDISDAGSPPETPSLLSASNLSSFGLGSLSSLQGNENKPAQAAASFSYFLHPAEAKLVDPRFFGRPPGHQNFFRSSPLTIQPSPALSNYSLGGLVGPGISWSQAPTPGIPDSSDTERWDFGPETPIRSPNLLPPIPPAGQVTPPCQACNTALLTPGERSVHEMLCRPPRQ